MWGYVLEGQKRCKPLPTTPKTPCYLYPIECAEVLSILALSFIKWTLLALQWEFDGYSRVLGAIAVLGFCWHRCRQQACLGAVIDLSPSSQIWKLMRICTFSVDFRSANQVHLCVLIRRGIWADSKSILLLLSCYNPRILHGFFLRILHESF